MQPLVLCSGGLDSTVLLARMVAQHGADRTKALSIGYGQRHSRELQAAQAVCAHYGVQLFTLDLASVFAQSDSTLLAHADAPLPEGSYADQQADAPDAPVSTYVPFRNGLFLSAAAAQALSLGCDLLCYGAHADDAAGSAYPDCSEAFVAAMGRAIAEGTGGQLVLEAPFASLSKAAIVAEGLRLGVPFELTWSCYEGGEAPCGACATCIDRARAFAANDALDPTTPAST